MNERPAFFYLLSTQYENLGDLVINRECLALLREAGELVVKTDAAPALFVEQLGVTSAERCDSGRGFYRRLAANVRGGAPTFLVLVPGAALGDLSPKQMLRQMGLAASYAALKALGVRIIRLGASMGPFSARRLRIERWKARTMAFIGLRDRLSLDYAAANGIAHTGPFPDFAFMLPTATRVPGAAEGPLLLSFRADNTAELEEIAAAVSRFLLRVDSAARLPLTIVSQVERDRATGRALAKRVGGGRPIAYVDAADGEAALFDVYAGAAGLLSNRLHVLMFALSRGAPVRGLVHADRNHKIIGLFTDAGLGDRLADLTRPAEIDAIPWPDSPVDAPIFAAMKQQADATLARILSAR